MQLRIFDKDITDRKVDEIISSGSVDMYLQQLVAYGQQSSELQHWFARAQDQRGALLDLEDCQ